MISGRIKERHGCAILDIGCKRGIDLREVASGNTAAFFIGADISFSELKEAASRSKENPNVFFFKARGEEPPFKDGSFDLVYSSEVIEHIKDVEGFLTAVNRLLKDGGVFIITTPSRFNYVSLVGKLVPQRLKNTLRRLVYYLPQIEENVNPHEYEYTPEEMRKIFERNGFKVERVIGGVLRVPVWPLFERIPFLVAVWKYLDELVEKIPMGINLKHNFVLEARKLT